MSKVSYVVMVCYSEYAWRGTLSGSVHIVSLFQTVYAYQQRQLIGQCQSTVNCRLHACTTTAFDTTVSSCNSAFKCCGFHTYSFIIISFWGSIAELSSCIQTLVFAYVWCDRGMCASPMGCEVSILRDAGC